MHAACARYHRAHREHGDQDSQVVGTDVWQEHIDQAAACVIHLHSGIRNKKLLLAYLWVPAHMTHTHSWRMRRKDSDGSTNTHTQTLSLSLPVSVCARNAQQHSAL
jgi:hypothetical protein